LPVWRPRRINARLLRLRFSSKGSGDSGKLRASAEPHCVKTKFRHSGALRGHKVKPPAGNALAEDTARSEAVAPNLLTRSLQTLYSAHRDGLTRYLRGKYGAGPPDPEDVVQQAFVQMARLDRTAIEAIVAPKSFLYRTAEHILIDEKRRYVHRERHASAVQAGIFSPEGSDFNPENVIVARDELAIIEKAIRAMSYKRRTAFLMHRIEGLSFAEIGRRMGIAAPVARHHVEKALIDIQRAVAKANGEGA
jgi:RNA polymerase sigma factor (sigma-70 family)